MNRLDQMKQSLVLEAGLHRKALQLERRLLAIRANSIRDDLRSNPLLLVASAIAGWKSRHVTSQPERWIRVATDALQMIRDLRRP